MVVPLRTTRIREPLANPHHAPEPEPKLHSRDSSYHPDLGAIIISWVCQATDIIQSLISLAVYHLRTLVILARVYLSTPLLQAHIHHRTLLFLARIHHRTPLLPAHIHRRTPLYLAQVHRWRLRHIQSSQYVLNNISISTQSRLLSNMVVSE
ncbi:hypothetical protein J1N35_011846 [Gossypium stocksii]|uniref:Uncharacterized protein n=1 Tax=Gossypium stocksii TaxID=47602 RepID=A0A9D3W4Y4_9ROSI|nr:hypothetical protein J1N35_011846 [Gossypium stocksii]